MRYLITILTAASFLWGGLYETGEALFQSKCSGCHTGYIPADRIKKNFFEQNNTLLDLKAPTVNMLVYAILRGPKKIGDPDDPEMQRMEIEEYLKSYLEHPVRRESICDPDIMRYYETKPPFKGLSDSDYEALAAYFMGYKKHRAATHPSPVKQLNAAYDPSRLLQEAQTTDKRIIIEASSPTCHYCRRMKREVIETDKVASLLKKGYILAEVNVDTQRLPFGLEKVYKKITPSFFILENNGTLIAHYPGSWKKHDFLQILQGYMPKSH